MDVARWFLCDRTYGKKIWKFKRRIYSVDRVYFSEKPFIVLEFSKKKKDLMKMPIHFLYDMSDVEFEQEIKSSLRIK